MATDARDSRRKHRRSSSLDEVDRSSKRHKHRHHHHRRGSKKREEESEHNVETVTAVPSSTPAPNSGPNNHWPDDDVEEGEILEEEVFGCRDGEIGKMQTESDAESGEIEVTGDRNVPPDKANLELFTKESLLHRETAASLSRHAGINAKISKTGREDINNNKINALALDGENGTCIHGNTSSDSEGEKHRTSGSLPCRDRYSSLSRSSDHSRDRSCSHSIIEEYAHSKRRHHSEERKVECSRGHGHGSRDLVVDDAREQGTSHHSEEARSRVRSNDRDLDRDFRREKERERSWNRDIDKMLGRGKEYERSHERDRREEDRDRGRAREVDRDRREKEQDQSWERVADRDRRREKERNRSRDKTRFGERVRDWESELDFKSWDRDIIKERDWERQDDRNGHKDRATVNGKDNHMVHENANDSRDRYRFSRHSRHEEMEYHQGKRRNFEPEKAYNSMGGSLEEGENTVESRGEDEQDDLDDKVILQLAEQEEEDLSRIKESRRRREAILEKYKKQRQQQVEQMPEIEVKGKESVDIPEGKNDGVGVLDMETSSADGKPQENGNADSERISGDGGLGEGTPKSERSDDKFCDDIFGETPTGVRKLGKGDGLQIEKVGLHDNWDDAEGYYNYRFGEILDGQYEVTAAHGRGVFSAVVRAKNIKAGNGEAEEVAIKIIRNNDTMYKAGMDELVILKKLVRADPDDKRHCVRYFSSFKYRNHLCLVFESLNMNLREVLKKFGRNIGLRLTAVRAYAKQLFIALKHLRNCGVLHCDIKPDNMLVNEAKNVLKLCDFGNAMFAGKNEVTPYLVSRFYRAPEIILGLPYDHPLDMWSVGCCLYEIYTGKVLFPGPTNNDMLRLHMELKGPFPKKMLRRGAFIEQHFGQDLNFLATEEDPVTKKTIKRIILNVKPRDIGAIITGSPGEDPKMLSNFKDLLEKVFVLDPVRRLTVSQALSHPFITGK